MMLYKPALARGRETGANTLGDWRCEALAAQAE
jgi:hypothetical protein